MSSPLSEYFEQRAAELADCADLERREDAAAVSLTIVPRITNALGVYLTDFRGQYVIGFDHPFHIPDEDADTPEAIDALLDPAVEGRVRMVIGPSRAQTLVCEGERYESWGFYGEGLRSLVPLPGWRRRAELVDFLPYRSVGDDQPRR